MRGRDRAFLQRHDPPTLEQGNVVRFGDATQEHPRLLVWGDSHAMADTPRSTRC